MRSLLARQLRRIAAALDPAKPASVRLAANDTFAAGDTFARPVRVMRIGRSLARDIARCGQPTRCPR